MGEGAGAAVLKGLNAFGTMSHEKSVVGVVMVPALGFGELLTYVESGVFRNICLEILQAEIKG